MRAIEPVDLRSVDRLDLDEDGERVGGRVVGARHAGDAFAGARLVDVELVRCDLPGCDFSEAVFQRVRLVDCRCIGDRAAAARCWRSVTFTDCRLDDANFRLAQLTQVRFDGSVLRAADFGGAQLDDVQFPGCDLAGADFSNAQCSDVDLRGARLDGLPASGRSRGATIGVDQLFGLAPGLAAATGLRIRRRDDD